MPVDCNKVTDECLQCAHDISGMPGAGPVQADFVKAAGLFAVAQAIRELAAAVRETKGGSFFE